MRGYNNIWHKVWDIFKFQPRSYDNSMSILFYTLWNVQDLLSINQCKIYSSNKIAYRQHRPYMKYGCFTCLLNQPHDCLLNCLFKRRSKKTSKLCVTGLCEGNSPVTGEFPAQRASNAENVSIWWRHHEYIVRKTDGHQIHFTSLRSNGEALVNSWSW